MTLERVAEEGERLASPPATAGSRSCCSAASRSGCAARARAVPPLAREYGDADFIGHARDRKAITAFMEEQGYVPDKMFNALHGAAG